MDEQNSPINRDGPPEKQNPPIIDIGVLLAATAPYVDEQFRQGLEARLLNKLDAKRRHGAPVNGIAEQRGGEKEPVAVEITTPSRRALVTAPSFSGRLGRGAHRAASLVVGLTLFTALFVSMSAMLQFRQSSGGATPGGVDPTPTTASRPLTATPVTPAQSLDPSLPLFSASGRLLDMSFVDASNGWALGYFCGANANCAATIRKTTDGGQNWQAMSGVRLEAGGNLLARRVYFANVNDGWAYDPSLFTTHDGGLTWVDAGRKGSILALASRGGIAWAIERTCSQGVDMLAQCARSLLTSGDNGRTWQPTAVQPRIRGPESQIVFASEKDAWIVSWRVIEPSAPNSPRVPTLVATHDGGNSWQELDNPCDAGSAEGSADTRLAALDSGRIWALCGTQPAAGGQIKALYFSADGGQRWNLVSGYPPGARPLFAPPSLTAVDTIIPRSTPGTATPIPALSATPYVSQGPPYSGYINDITFVSPQRGFITLFRGTIFRTDDGGRTWREAIPYEAANPLDGGVGPVRFVDPMRGWLATQPGLFRTVDGGLRWDLLGTPEPPVATPAPNKSESNTGPTATALTSASPATPTALPRIVTEVSSPTVVPQEVFTFTTGMRGDTVVGVKTVWQMWQPKGIKPMWAEGERGVLWVRFPAMLTNEAIVRWGLSSRPAGDYAVMYTPLRPGGGDLSQGAQTIAMEPGNGQEGDVRPTALEVVTGERFLLKTYTLQDGAQNGGTNRTVWIEPQTGTTKELVAAKTDGGSFLTEARDDRWLFWNRYENNAAGSGPLMKNAYAYLVDLQTGTAREVKFGGENWTEDAQWQPDGTLRFTLARNGGIYSLDPQTGSVLPYSGGGNNGAIEAIRAFAKDPALDVHYGQSGKMPYGTPDGNDTVLVETYYAGLDQYVVLPSAGNKVIQYGERLRAANEAPRPVDTTARYTQAQLEQMARTFIAERLPGLDLSRLTANGGNKQGGTGTNYFFRWEDRSAGPGGYVDGLPPLVQVGFSTGGTLLSYQNTLFALNPVAATPTPMNTALPAAAASTTPGSP